MASKNTKREYLFEHVRYEVLMLRHTYARLHKDQAQLDWNAFLESYVVHARNLIDFLCNEKDARTYIADDYAEGYAPKKKNKIHGTLTKLDEQVLHLSKNRKLHPKDKINIKRIERLKEWFEEAYDEFKRCLKNSYFPYEDIPVPAAKMIRLPPADSSATNAIITTPTSSSATMSFLRGSADSAERE